MSKHAKLLGLTWCITCNVYSKYDKRITNFTKSTHASIECSQCGSTLFSKYFMNNESDEEINKYILNRLYNV